MLRSMHRDPRSTLVVLAVLGLLLLSLVPVRIVLPVQDSTPTARGFKRLPLITLLRSFETVEGVPAVPDLRATYLVQECLFVLDEGGYYAPPLRWKLLNKSYPENVTTFVLLHYNQTTGGFGLTPVASPTSATLAATAMAIKLIQIIGKNATEVLQDEGLLSAVREFVLEHYNSSSGAFAAVPGGDPEMKATYDAVEVLTTFHQGIDDTMRVQIIRWVNSCEIGGGYSEQPGESASLEATYYAIRIFELLNATDQINATKVAAFVNGTWVGDGSFNGTLRDTYYAISALYAVNQSRAFFEELRAFTDWNLTIEFVKNLRVYCSEYRPRPVFSGGFGEVGLRYSSLKDTMMAIGVLDTLRRVFELDRASTGLVQDPLLRRYLAHHVTVLGHGSEVSPGDYNPEEGGSYTVELAFCLADALHALGLKPANVTGMIDWLQSCYVEWIEEGVPYGAFAPASGFIELANYTTRWTYYVSRIYEIVGEQIPEALREPVARWLVRMQLEDGGFVEVYGGEESLRGTLWSLTALDVLGMIDRINRTAAIDWLEQCYNSTARAYAANPQADPNTLLAGVAQECFSRLDAILRFKKASLQELAKQQNTTEGSELYGSWWGDAYATAIALKTLGEAKEEIQAPQAGVDYLMRYQHNWGGFGITNATLPELNLTRLVVYALVALNALPIPRIEIQVEWPSEVIVSSEYHRFTSNASIEIQNRGRGTAYDVNVSQVLSKNLTIIALKAPNASQIEWEADCFWVVFDEIQVNQTVIINLTLATWLEGSIEASVKARYRDAEGACWTEEKPGLIVEGRRATIQDLEIEQSMPEEPRAGEEVVWQIALKNPGEGPLLNISVNANATQFIHVLGVKPNYTVEYSSTNGSFALEIPLIEGNSSLTVNITIEWVRTGNQTIEQLSASYLDMYGELHSVNGTDLTLFVRYPAPPPLRIKRNAPEKAVVHEPFEVSIEVVNNSTELIRNLTISDPVPEWAEIVEETDANFTNVAPNTTVIFRRVLKFNLEGVRYLGPTTIYVVDELNFTHKLELEAVKIYVSLPATTSSVVMGYVILGVAVVAAILFVAIRSSTRRR